MIQTFFVPGQPKAKGRPRMTRRGHVFTPKATKEAEREIADSVSAQGAEVEDGPVSVTIKLMMQIPKSWPEWKKDAARMGHYRHVSRPDVDNLVKLTKDALNGICWKDDSQVYHVTAEKMYADSPGTWIEVAGVRQAEREDY